MLFLTLWTGKGKILTTYKNLQADCLDFPNGLAYGLINSWNVKTLNENIEHFEVKHLKENVNSKWLWPIKIVMVGCTIISEK